jgi:hypothetical protein
MASPKGSSAKTRKSPVAKTYLRVSLRITHETRAPDDISKLLGRKHDHSGIKGGRRGSASSRAIWAFNYWVVQFDSEGESPADRVAAIARFVEGNEAAMRLLLQTGGKAEIYAFIGVEREEVGFTVESAVLAILGRVGVDLGIDIFPPTPKGPHKGANATIAPSSRRADDSTNQGARKNRASAKQSAKR